MKKITLFTLLLFAFCWQTNAQIYIEESLDSGIPTGWTQSSYFSSTNSNYLCEGTGNLADNMYGSSANDGTITSKNHVGISNGTDTSVTFEWLARPYTTNAVDFIIYVEYSTDNGSSWTSMPQFAVNTTTPCTTYSETILAANLPSGSDFKFQIRGEWQSGDSYFYLDNILISQTITCHQPSNLTATNITTTQANLGWTENGTASLYNVEVLATGTTPTGTATDTGVANGFTKTGLTSNTNYEYYVQADCTGGDLSAWVGPFAFKTLCDPVSTFPWSEGFENITVGQPDCWGIAGTTTTASYHFYSYTTGYSGRGMRFNSYTNSSGNTSELTTPELDLSSLNTAELKFWYKNPTGGDFEILISTDGGSNFISLENGLTGQSTWFEKTIDITSHIDSDVIIQFKGTSNYGSGDARIYLDEVTVREIPSCVDPSDLTATNIIATQANLGWTERGTASLYNVEVVTAGTTPTGTATDTGVANGFTKTGLTPDTNYEYYVQADCTGGDLSAWVGPFAFKTTCVAFTAPYSQNFDTFTTSSSAFNDENCWRGTNIGDYLWEVALTTDTSSGSTGPGSGVSNGNYLFTESSNGATGDVINLVSPLIDLRNLTVPSLSFDYHMFGANMGTLKVIVSEGGTDTTVETITGQQQTAETDPFETKFVNLSAYANKTVQITFQGVRGTDYTSDMAIDTVIIDELPSCVDPSDLTATNITATQANLGWTEIGTATLYNVEIVTAGTTPTGTATDSGVANGFTKTGLMPNTNYEYYVQADCTGGDLSAWVGPFAFSTPCSSITPDYNADMSINVPACWDEANSGDASSGPMDIGSGLWYASNHGGTPSNAINLYFNTRSDWIISPVFDLSTAAPSELNIYVALTENQISGSGADLGSDDEISLLMTIDGGTTWTSMQSWTQGNVPTDIGQEITYNLSAVNGNVQFAFLGDEGSVNDTEDVYFHVSKFQVRETPSCIDPSNLTATNITTTQANLGWTENGTASLYNVEFLAAGTTPTGTATDTGVANGFTKTGLTSSTNYEYYVQADCTGGDLSPWVGPFAFTTACGTTSTFPWSEGFENITVGQPVCWGIAGTTTTASYHFYSYATGYSGRGMRFDSYVNSSGNTSELTTPELDLSSLNTAELKFWYKNPTGGDFEILISTDGGSNFISLENGLTGQSTWFEKTIDITSHIDSDVIIQFKGTSNYGSGDARIYLDEVTVREIPTMSLKDNALEGVSIVPNPVTTILKFNAPEKIQQISVFNLLGQEVMRTNPNAVKTELSVENLQTGMYIVKVKIGEQFGVYKILKD